jgi:hypothetical protein
MNGIQVKYTELFTLSVEQLFYQNKVCKQYKTDPVTDITFVPTPECRDIMSGMDLLFKPTPTTGGFTVLASVSGATAGGNELLRFAAKKAGKLTFLLLLKNPELLNFNDLPVQAGAENIYYFSNSVADAAAPRNNLHLAKAATGAAEADSIKTSSAAYTFHSPTPVAPGTTAIKHLLTGAGITEKNIITQSGASDVFFDLTPLPSGVCQLWINHVLQDEFYYPGNISYGPLFGVAEIALSPLLDANYRVIEADRSLTPERPQYKLRFVNRPTIWRYTLQLQPNSPLFLEMAGMSPADKAAFLNQLNIVTNDTNVHFHRTTTTDTIIEMVSDNALALQENYYSASSTTHDTLSLTLKKYIGDPAKEAVVKANLPYPATGTIDTANAPFIYSDIFLTL